MMERKNKLKQIQNTEKEEKRRKKRFCTHEYTLHYITCV